MADMSGTSGAGLSPGKLDDGETFTESDLSLSHSNTEAVNERVQLGIGSSTTANRTNDDGTYNGESQSFGLKINPNTALDGVRGKVSQNSSGATKAILKDGTGTTIASTTEDLGTGDYFDLHASLSSGTTYTLVLDNPGGTWDVGAWLNSSYSGDTSTDIDITGVKDNGYGMVPAITEVTGILNPPTSGSCYVRWSSPNDIRSWDRAIFEANADSETADVYIEENDGSGWTEIAGPIATGDDIPAKTSSSVRYRIDFSRTSVSNNPRLESIYRRYII